MSNWMSNLRAFGRGTNPARNQNQPPNRANTSSPSGYSQSSLGPPSIPPAPPSPSLTQTMATNDQAHQTNATNGKVPFFFREDYANFIVKGNFMTLANKPQNIELGEWLAHQLVEQKRILTNMLNCVFAEDRSKGQSICNEQTCPTMTAGVTIYPWVDTKGNPINLPAAAYIKNIQIWVNGKIQDPTLFPTETFTSAPQINVSVDPSNKDSTWLGKTSGFPQRFETEIKNMYKQMFRCYAHLYWSHWLNFWDLSSHRELNTCFMHFISVGRTFHLITERDTEPMQPLIDLWIKQGVLQGLPAAAAAAAAAGGASTANTSSSGSASAATA